VLGKKTLQGKYVSKEASDSAEHSHPTSSSANHVICDTYHENKKHPEMVNGNIKKREFIKLYLEY
jgi:hypothetical protein